MNVLVIGSASPLARVLLPALLNDARIERVIGVDIRTGGFSHPNYCFRPVDVRAPELAVSLAEVDAVIHLGFAATGRRFGPLKLTRELMRDVNVRGSQNVFHPGGGTGREAPHSALERGGVRTRRPASRIVHGKPSPAPAVGLQLRGRQDRARGLAGWIRTDTPGAAHRAPAPARDLRRARQSLRQKAAAPAVLPAPARATAADTMRARGRRRPGGAAHALRQRARCVQLLPRPMPFPSATCNASCTAALCRYRFGRRSY